MTTLDKNVVAVHSQDTRYAQSVWMYYSDGSVTFSSHGTTICFKWFVDALGQLVHRYNDGNTAIPAYELQDAVVPQIEANVAIASMLEVDRA